MKQLSPLLRLCAITALILTLSTVRAADDDPKPAPRNSQSALMRKVGESMRGGARQRVSVTVRKAFSSIVQQARKGTVTVYRQGKPVAMGAIVAPDGYVLTKASELQTDELQSTIECELFDNRKFSAAIMGIAKPHDLAMLRVDAKDLPTIAWSDEAPAVGSIIATTSTDEFPKTIGVVSVVPRSIAKPRGVLGVALSDAADGVAVERVFRDSAADHAGLKEGDIIQRVNGAKVGSREELVKAIGSYEPGDKIRLRVKRGEENRDATATLGSSFSPEHGRRMEFQENLGGPLSKRRTGFPVAFQHDTVLMPRDCGGPLVDLDGKVVGINIARASRVSSYALPASIVQGLIPQLKSGELAPGPSLAERRRQLSERLAELNQRIQEVTKRITVYQVTLGETSAAEQMAREALEKAKDDAKAQVELNRVLKEKANVESMIADLEKKLQEVRTQLDDAEVEKVKLDNES